MGKTDIDKWLKKAVQAYRAADPERCRRYCQKVIGQAPDNADALHFLGLVCLQDADLEAAASLVGAAIEADPGYPDFHHSLARIQMARGKPEDALSSFRKAVSISPNAVPSIYAMGALYQQMGRFAEAERCYRSCLKQDPKLAAGHNNLGLVLKAQGDIQAAIRHFQQAVKLDPGLFQAFNNLGVACQESGAFQAALTAFQAAIKTQPQYGEAYYNMAIVLDSLGRFHEAVACYRHALQINPDLAMAYNNLGITLEKIGRTTDAVDCFQKALGLKEGNPHAHFNMAVIFYQQNRLEAAIAHARRTIEIDPGYEKAYYTLFEQLREGCCWDALREIETIIDAKTTRALADGIPPSESPFLSVTRTDDKPSNHAIAACWSRELAKRVSKFRAPFRLDRPSKAKITIGYLSNRFRNAATGHLMAGLFGCHNKRRFNIHCYSWGENDGSYFRKTIEANSDKFTDISRMGFVEAAELINRDGVDILVDLKGFTRNNRMEICALRPAPIQIAYMNFNSTSGADFFDYIIGDPIVSPASHHAYYSEKIVCMPHTFMVTDATLGMQTTETSRASQNLPEAAFVFCSFNQFYKIEPELFARWMRILRESENSVLWLLHGNDLAVKNLKMEAERHGVDRRRLVFSGRVKKQDHLARLKLADAVLDTRIYNGHTTTVDALLAGVPVVTLMGDHFASRVSASLLAAIGLPELTTTSYGEYVEKSVRLANDHDFYRRIQNRLERNRSLTALFNTREFVISLENAFEQMWDNYLAGQPPRHIDVDHEKRRATQQLTGYGA